MYITYSFFSSIQFNYKVAIRYYNGIPENTEQNMYVTLAMHIPIYTYVNDIATLVMHAGPL